MILATPVAAAPVTLDDSLARAFTSNPTIRRSETELARAAGTQLLYNARAWPRLNANLNGGWRSGSLYDSSGPFSTADGQLVQPLVDVAIPASRRRGQWEILIAQQQYYAAVSDQLAATEESFLWAQLYRDTLQIYDRMRERLQANVAASQERVDTGAASRAIVLQARTQLLDLTTRIEQTAKLYHHARVRLAELLGLSVLRPDELPEPAGALAVESPAIDWARAAAAAREYRPDIQLLRALVAASEDDEMIQRAGYFPRIELVASGFAIPESTFTRPETEFVPGRDRRSSEVRVGPTMTWRVIDDGRTTGARRQALARAERFRVLLQALEDGIPRELERIRTAQATATSRRQTIAAAIEQAEKGLSLVEQKLDVGTGTQLDYLNAQRNLLSLQAGLVWTTFQHARAMVEFNRASGRYLRFVDAAE